MTISASTVILEYVCPCLGMIIANCMWLAPLKDLQTAVRRKSLKDLNPTPWTAMLGNCYGWCLYGILNANFWVYFANAPGVLLSVWLNLGAVKLLYQEHHTQQMRASFLEYYEQEEEYKQQVRKIDNKRKKTKRKRKRRRKRLPSSRKRPDR